MGTNIPEPQHSRRSPTLHALNMSTCTKNFNSFQVLPKCTHDSELGVLYLKSFFAGSLNLMVVLLCAQRASFCTFPHKVESASIAGASRA